MQQAFPSSFSKEVESPDVAMFIKKVYMKLIDDYFPNASFFKPTGDGLFIIIPYSEENLEDIARQTIAFCLKVLTEFGAFCSNDQMINFEVPRRVGIGISRGTACRLVSKNKTLDYSGRVLNLASRLMDLARPTGIVFDAGFGIELLSDNQIKLFAKDSVYIKGIAEKEPIDIYYTKELTHISLLNKHPLKEIKWNTITDTKTLKQIKDFGPRFVYDLPTKSIDPDNIKVKIKHTGVVRGRRRKEILAEFDFPNFEYFREAGKSKVRIDFESLAKRLEVNGVKDNWEVKIEIMYPER